MDENVRGLAERGNRQPDWVFAAVVRFVQVQKERVENKERSPATPRNYINAVNSSLILDFVSMWWMSAT